MTPVVGQNANCSSVKYYTLMKNTALLVVVAIAAAFTFALSGQEQRAPQLPSSQSMGADPVVVAKLSEIVAIRQAALERAKLTFTNGDIGEDQLATLRLDLAEARITVAQEQGQKEAVRTALKEIVSIHELRNRLLEALGAGGPSQEDRAKIRVALLESEVRLLKAQH